MAKNDAYWAERARILENALYDISEDYAKALERTYNRTIQSLEADIAKWYDRLARNNDISLAEARRLLDANELKEFRWTVEEYIERAKESGVDGRWIKELENASARVHISRYEALKVTLTQQAELLAKETEATIFGMGAKVYAESFYKNAFDIQKGIGLAWNVAVDRGKLHNALVKPWTLDERTFSDRIWTNKQGLLQGLQTELTQSLMRGEAPDRAIKAVSDKYGGNRSQAARLVQTESAAIAANAALECYRQLRVEKYRIIATLDLKTSQICRDLDGEMYPIELYRVGETAPPFHPRCRTTTSPASTDTIGERIARDPATGKTYTIPAGYTYHRWYQEFVVEKSGAEDAARYQAMARNETKDREELADLKRTLGKDAPKSLAQLQELKYTDSETWKQMTAYRKAVNRGTLSPLATYRQYDAVCKQLQADVVGVTTASGTTITGYSNHFVDRIFGSIEQRRSGVEIESILDALKNPVKVDAAKGEGLFVSQRYRGSNCFVTVNPKTGSLVQTNPKRGGTA